MGKLTYIISIYFVRAYFGILAKGTFILREVFLVFSILHMEAKILNTVKPHVFFKTIAQLIYVERWVEFLAENASDAHVTVVFKLGQRNLDKLDSLVLKSKLERYWKRVLGPTTEFGQFYNQEIGTVFITGPYAAMFVQEVDGKKLGALSEGLFGILRGMGLNREETFHAIEKLREGQYLVLGRTSTQYA